MTTISYHDLPSLEDQHPINQTGLVSDSHSEGAIANAETSTSSLRMEFCYAQCYLPYMPFPEQASQYARKCLSFVMEQIYAYMDEVLSADTDLIKDLDNLFEDSCGLAFFGDMPIPSITSIKELVNSSIRTYEGAISFSVQCTSSHGSSANLSTLFDHLGTAFCEACLLSDLIASRNVILNEIHVSEGNFFTARCNSRICFIVDEDGTLEWTDIHEQISRNFLVSERDV